ncbi:DUF4351 domain-containing protein [Schlesneria sp. T3-172]|uniref:DUF4351 domain-containing protein n=1 Tax=Schlesneria sphaerica TaxID=3373610 RepID=UPI0037CC0611
MPYVTSIERHAEQRGLEQGLERGSTRILLRILSRICGEVPEKIQAQIKTLSLEQRETLGESAIDFRSLDDLKNWLTNNNS